MKSILYLFSFLLIFYSCGNKNTELDCKVTGCKAGTHCDFNTSTCIKDCTQEECDKIDSFCNENTKICEPWCKFDGCSQGLICNEIKNECTQSCLDVGCEEGKHCNQETQFCENDCNKDTDCNSRNNEVCDLETKICTVKSSNPCTSDNDCPEDSYCYKRTGYCKGGCANIECEENKICNPETLECVLPCRLGSCEENKYCNIEQKVCRTMFEYPQEPYGKNPGDTIENLSWQTLNKGIISTGKYYSLNKNSGFPRILILNEIIGSHNEENNSASLVEAESLGNFYNNTILNGYHRFEILQGFLRIDENIPTETFIKNWQTQYNQKFISVEDFSKKINEYNTDESKGVPFKILIDASNMKILDFIVGTNSNLSELEAKLRKYEKRILCDRLDCESQNSYCIYKYTDGTARCN